MERINVEIHWCDKNFSCVWGTPEFGSVIVTNNLSLHSSLVIIECCFFLATRRRNHAD